MIYTEARIIADSVGPNKKRLTTFEWKYPRIIHAEVMTHRRFSRNAASSRAIPTTKIIDSISNEAFIPTYWGKNVSGMQAFTELPADIQEEARRIWMEMVQGNVEASRKLHALGVHKQLANRPLEVGQYMTTIVSATEWSNFFTLRTHEDAQPEFRHLAMMAREIYDESQPKQLKAGDICRAPAGALQISRHTDHWLHNAQPGPC